MKNVRMSAQKMREVVRQIQGLPAAQAASVLAVVPRKGARFVAKTLKSAIANAEDLKEHKKEYNGMRTERLIVKEALAQTASTLRRF
ncbi:MAG: uL22 family ribosomal protein, partial [Verrucomicrobia bacterium]|nr:uL22 family ribosomal protein [Verrucomicrobiota bacterium]